MTESGSHSYRNDEPTKWPSVQEQLLDSHATPGSALERLIRDNQDFGLLDRREAGDKLPYPPWLRVQWREAHPETTYSADDPTGGYPVLLARVHSWMLANQNLSRERTPR